MPRLPGRGGIVAARPPRHIGPNRVRYRTRRVVRAPVGGVVGAGAGGTVKSGIGTGGAAGSLFEILFASVFLADMGDVLEAVSGAAKTFLEMNNLTIDNATFKLFYRATTVVLFASAFFSTAQQLFGEPISCEVHMGTGIKDDVLNAFCWMYSTFNIPSDYKGSCAKKVQDPTALYNTYYQWVPIFLGIKGALFCLPRLLWLMMEGGLIKFLARGATGKRVEDPREKAELLVDTFHNNLHNRYNLYALSFFLCEQINALVLFLVWLATDRFLKGQFAVYGPSVFSYYNLVPSEDRERFSANPMCEVFPRISACNFVRYGSAGFQENQNAICVLSLNMVNDKLFLILWYWYAVLTIAVCHRLLYRLIQMVWPAFRFQMLHMRIRKYLRSKARVRYVEEFIKHCSIGDWFVLYQLSRNMNKRFYVEFLLTLVDVQHAEGCDRGDRGEGGRSSGRNHPEIRIVECEDQSETATVAAEWGLNLPKSAERGKPDSLSLAPEDLYMSRSVVYRRGSKASVHSELLDLGFDGAEDDA